MPIECRDACKLVLLRHGESIANQQNTYTGWSDVGLTAQGKAQAVAAGIDCGTNSIRLKVSRVDENGVEDIVPRILRVIRLGQDVDKTHRFADEALERAYAAAREFAGSCRAFGLRLLQLADRAVHAFRVHAVQNDSQQ